MSEIIDNSTKNQQSWSHTHPATEADQAAMAALRPMALPGKGSMRGIAARPAFEAILARTAVAAGVTFREGSVGGIPGWWCEPENARAYGVLLHIHGGWFGFGSAEGYRPLVSHLAVAAGLRAFVPDYRLAPEHPFPAALQDVACCYLGLLEQDAGPVVLSGDSAGGNLALSFLASSVQRADLPAPACALALSPVTDLTQSGTSWHSRAEVEPYFVFDQGTELIAAYLNGHDAADPAASPLFAKLEHLPPVLVHVGDDEVLLDDAIRFGARAAAAGVNVRVDVWEGMPHGFVSGVGRFDAAGAALAAIGEFIAGELGAA